jgi:hypothetical protein
MTERRQFLKAGAALAAVGPALVRADERPRLWQGRDFGPAPAVSDRLDQGPFGIEQDEGWYTIATTTPDPGRVRNPGLGLVGYTWEENGPSLAARSGQETLEQSVEQLAALPFVDVLYVRCDWRDVQSRPGRLDLHPVFALTRDAARRRGRRFAFRVQLSNPEIQPAKLALPDFLQEKVPLVTIRRPVAGSPDRVEPRYDHPEFQRAFRELNELLAAEFDGDPLVEFADLMMYGFWGEGHTSDYPSPIPDPALAERTFLDMTERQIAAWRRVPLVVNTQPDISRTGNRAVLERAVRGGCWLRSDSVILDEPEQIEELAHRPPWLAVVMEDGYHRHYRTDTARYRLDAAGVDVIEQTSLGTGSGGPRPSRPSSAASATACGRRGCGSGSAPPRTSWSWRSPTTASRRCPACFGSSPRRVKASPSPAARSTPATRWRADCASPRSSCRPAWAGARCACGPSSR